ncbi:MAG: 1-acyl-sn-glycerol-3-phosphate acyltransferase [Deltaproteobacteria bacterium]|nr:1-acyl-sn-glycerol-3-phosphate acyltransferase [Deltaproteobacteria bacterium]
MNQRQKALLHLQYILGRLFVFVTVPLMYAALKTLRYSIRDLRSTRRTVKYHLSQHRGPWLVCANHLTMIDSVILAYAMAPLWRYAIRFNEAPWNLPERANFQRNIVLTILCYLTKCIPVSRGGDREEMKKTLDSCLYQLNHGQPLLIFPEGGRSRTGFVNTEIFSYGAGRLALTAESCRVLCLYLRGDGQSSYSNIPRYKERFTVLVDSIKPHSNHSGLKGHRDCARQIIEKLAAMEKIYLDTHWQRYRGPRGTAHQDEEQGCTIPGARLHSA